LKFFARSPLFVGEQRAQIACLTQNGFHFCIYEAFRARFLLRVFFRYDGTGKIRFFTPQTEIERPPMKQKAEQNPIIATETMAIQPQPTEPTKPGNGHIGMAQINTTPGDLQGNALKIIRYLSQAEAMGLDLVIFPELALMGYPPRDVIGRYPALVTENLKWLNALAQRTGKTFALVGFVEPRLPLDNQPRIGKPYFNAAAVLGEGRIQAVIRKSLLPEYGEFEDVRQFESAPLPGAYPPETRIFSTSLANTPSEQSDDASVSFDNGIITIHGVRYGISICEDLWTDPDFFENPLYAHDPIATLTAQRPDVLINLSASPTRARKERMKHNLCAHIARKYKTPLVYVNQVGSVDEVSFDGQSRAYTAQGQLLARGKAFEEQLFTVNFAQNQGDINPIPPELEASQTVPKTFDADDESDLGRIYAVLCQGIRDYFAKTGFRRALLGVSGGLDSSVAVVLLADALGSENVLALSMPSELTPQENRDDASTLTSNLGVELIEIPIAAATQTFTDGLDSVRSHLTAHWGDADPRSNATDNIQAISRATLLRQIGNEFRAFPIATCDKSELYLGYATVNGDMSGALAPLGDVPKTRVRALAHWLNKHRRLPDGNAAPAVIPEHIIRKPSGADLKRDTVTGQLVTAEEELMPYAFADEIIWRLETLQQSETDMQTAVFQYEQQVSISSQQKAAWLKAFFERMSRAVFKWFVAPPILLVEGNGSLAKSDYHHPIVAGRIAWKGHTSEDITHILDNAQKTIV
jgi:NAD+ synthase (glutamine-hydrolysing)